MENVGKGKKVSVSKIMAEVGYSPASAKNPSILTRAKGTQDVFEKMFPDSDLASYHKRLMDSAVLREDYYNDEVSDSTIKQLFKSLPAVKLLKIIRKKKVDSDVYHKLVYYTCPNGTDLKNALDMMYKIKKKYDDDKQMNLNLTVSGFYDRINNRPKA